MHVARTVMELKDLGGLRDRAEKRIVTSRPLFLLIISYRSSFGMTCRALNTAIEIDGDSCGALFHEPVEHQVAIQGMVVCQSMLVNVREHSTHRRNTGQGFESKGLSYQGIVPVEIEITEITESENQVNDDAFEYLAVCIEMTGLGI